jgi:hypothetical protein
MSEKELGPGSEGDAYRYTKKVLLSLPNVDEIRRIYTEIAFNRNISSWTRACYEELRRQFFRDGQCKIKFAPGLARIAYGELLFGTGDEDFRQLADLRDFVRIISIAHFTEFTRHIAIDGKELSFKDLVDRFGSTVSGNWKELKRELGKIQYGPRRYKVIWLDSFATANKYYQYTAPHSWCHLGSKSMFKSYSYSRKTDSKGNSRISVVKLYLAVLPGFETMTEDDPLYGESMLGIDIGPDGRLMHVNNRWNHAHDNIDERKGDNKYSERELSELMGGPFYKLCPPFSKRDYNHVESVMKRARQKDNTVCLSWAKKLAAKIAHAVNAKCSTRERKFVDTRDGREYRTAVIGNREWMLDPVSYISVPDIRESTGVADNRKALEHDWYCFDELHSKKGLRYESEGRITVGNRGVVYHPEGDIDIEMDGDLVEGCVQDEEIIPDPVCLNKFMPLTSIDIDRNGHAKVYMSSDVCKMSDSGNYDSYESHAYQQACDNYRQWRADTIDPGENKLDKDGKYVMYSDDNYCGVFVDEYSALEMITPLGFDKTRWKTLHESKQRILVNDLDADRNFVFYSAKTALHAIPAGWRVPTLFEFLSMAIAKGAKFRFSHGNGVSKDANAVLVTREGVVSKEDAVDDLKGLVFEELIEGKMERKYDTKTTNALLDSITAAPRIVDAGQGADEDIDETVEDPADTAMAAPQQQPPQDDGFGFDLNAAVPPLNIRLPAMEFAMKKFGFAFPEEIRQEAKPFAFDEAKPMLARPILLSLDGVDKMNETEVKKFCRKFGNDGSFKYFHNDDYTDELEDAVHDLLDAVDAETAQASGVDDVPKKPYACATWSESDNTFTISVKDRFDTSGNYFMLYCVKDNKQLMPTI